MGTVSGGVNNLVDGAELQRRINDLDDIITATVKHPEWFVDPTGAGNWCVDEIDQLEAELLARIESENEKSRLAGRLVETQSNIIRPSIPQWRTLGKGDIRI